LKDLGEQIPIRREVSSETAKYAAMHATDNIFIIVHRGAGRE
jgi:hypothetical protein